MAIDDALCLLAEVAAYAEGMLPSVAGNRRNERKVRDVSGAFKEYERRLRALHVRSDMCGLTNSKRDCIGRIAKRTQMALLNLNEGDEDQSLALDRAYANGEQVEELLDELIQCRHVVPASGASERYRAGNFVPHLPDNLYLDFDSRGEEGNFVAPEADVKYTLMASTTSSSVIAARGASGSGAVHGASGMAGVGKTTTLIALGHDRDIRDHFSDGDLYMTLGADATRLSKIMKLLPN